MRYMGGKAKIAKELSVILDQFAPVATCYVEPFMGGLNVAPQVSITPKLLSDANPSLARLYSYVQEGGVLPTTVTEEDYAWLRTQPDNPLHGFAEFGCSFGGKSWGGLARGGGRNFADECATGVGRDVGLCGDAVFTASDYGGLDIKDGALVYCDPPYANTTGYKQGGFDHEMFWWWVRALSDRCYVLVSEYAAPNDMVCVWDVAKAVSLAKDAHTAVRERVFCTGMAAEYIRSIGGAHPQRSLL